MKKIISIFILLTSLIKPVFAENINERDKYRNTQLHHAAYKGDLEEIKKLLAKGADINSQGGDNFTALQIAVLNNNLKIAQELLAHGANASIVDLYNRTPIFSTGSGAMAELLFAHGAKANLSDKWKVTPLHRAAKRCYIDVVKVLIKENANVKATDQWGCTPLHSAAICGNVELAALILKKGASINQKCDEGRSPLFYAAGFANVEMVKFLLENKADVFTKTDYGTTILEVAANDEGLLKPITLNSDPEIIQARKEIVKLLKDAIAAKNK